MIRLLTLGPAKHEKVAIYVVNQRISNVCRIAGADSSRAIRRHSVSTKGILTRVLSVVVICGKTCYAGYNHL